MSYLNIGKCVMVYLTLKRPSQGTHAMLYLTLGLSLSLTNICQPLSCIFSLFSWRDANEIILESSDENQVPETVAEMRELIEALKEDKTEDKVGDALSTLITSTAKHIDHND